MSLDLRDVPDRPGVYLLKDGQSKVLYVGKSVNLKNRLKYYTKPVPEPRINRLIELAKEVDYYEVGSEIESLILEVNLIKKYLPEYNVQLKDDKDYLYIIITKERFSKVLPARKRSITTAKYYFGPFPSSSSVRSTLKTLRRIFPYSTCKPPPTEREGKQKRACLHYHLGLCPGVCIGKASEKEYKKNIKDIVLFLEGKKQTVVNSLKKEMKEASGDLRYEKAGEISRKVKSLEYVLQKVHSVEKHLEDHQFMRVYREEELKDLQKVLNLKKIPRRIEGYDISNIQGEFATGSMVVFANGSPEKSEYRKFKIKKVVGINDTEMMKEILKRRFKNDWPLPDLIVVDGGKGQLSAVKSVLKELNVDIDFASLAKRLEQIFTPIKAGPITLPRDSKALHVIQRLRDEAHRFAISYHRHLRERNILTPK